MLYFRNINIAVLVAVLLTSLYGCASVEQQQCPAGTLNMPNCPPADAVVDKTIDDLYELRTWREQSELTIDPVKLAEEAKVPINSVRAKVIGPAYEDALTSLAAKTWMIENAQHTIDATYYIFKRDLAGYAVLGAMCNAVKRGVDVRIMVDSLGSMHPGHSELRALETCAESAGFMRNDKGQLTTKKARAQVVIFNAITKFNFNRRSQLLIVDGAFADKAKVITGGRNISVDYYGINDDGTKDPNAFRDLEIFLRRDADGSSEDHTVGDVGEIYYTLLFLYKGNRRIWPYEANDEFDEGKYDDIYIYERKKAQDNLALLKSLPGIKEIMAGMPHFMNDDFRETKVRFAHQLSNLTSSKVTTNVLENVESNPNSILYLMDKVTKQRLDEGVTSGTIRIVSPYLFSGEYKNEEGEVVYDGAKNTLELLQDNPGIKLEIITNSVLTSDNFFTQSMIDMEMAPRLLLTPELREEWLSNSEEGEFNPALVESEEWKKLINHPQIFIYETGGIDSVELGGDVHYGKLHAKFIVGDQVGFIGTSNFDYRSNLYNNELGFFYHSDVLRDDLVGIFEQLKSTSLRWGTPEWLEMRRKVMDSDSKKAGPARKQRGTYKTIRALGLEYLM